MFAPQAVSLHDEARARGRRAALIYCNSLYLPQRRARARRALRSGRSRGPLSMQQQQLITAMRVRVPFPMLALALVAAARQF